MVILGSVVILTLCIDAFCALTLPGETMYRAFSLLIPSVGAGGVMIDMPNTSWGTNIIGIEMYLD